MEEKQTVTMDQQTETKIQSAKQISEARYIKAFDMFMNDPRRLNLTDIARELHISPINLVKYAQDRNWEQMRLNSANLLTTAQNERRLNKIKVIDERIIETIDTLSKLFTNQYMDLANKASTLPTDPNDVPDDELEKDDHGNVKRRPKRQKLIQDKVFLLNEIRKGAYDMAKDLNVIGLLSTNKGINADATSENLKQLTSLNILISNIQSKKTEKSLSAVIDIKSDNKGTDGE
jgi:hypothetical protein